jgi:hypothetical protein
MDRPLRPPLEVQQPERVGRLPQSMPGGIMFQVKLDGSPDTFRCLTPPARIALACPVNLIVR